MLSVNDFIFVSSGKVKLTSSGRELLMKLDMGFSTVLKSDYLILTRSGRECCCPGIPGYDCGSSLSSRLRACRRCLLRQAGNQSKNSLVVKS